MSDSDVRAFEAILKGSSLRPGGAQHEGARWLWNGLIDRRPGLTVTCRGVEDAAHVFNLKTRRSKGGLR